MVFTRYLCCYFAGDIKVCSVAKSWNLKLTNNKRVVMRFGALRTNDNVTFNYSRILESISSHKDLGFLLIQGFGFMHMYGLLFGKLERCYVLLLVATQVLRFPCL